VNILGKTGKIKCNECGFVIEVPKGTCQNCFSDILGDLCDIEDFDLRLEKITDFINELCHFEYQRGQHNLVCENKLDLDGVSYEWDDCDNSEEEGFYKDKTNIRDEKMKKTKLALLDGNIVSGIIDHDDYLNNNIEKPKFNEKIGIDIDADVKIGDKYHDLSYIGKVFTRNGKISHRNFEPHDIYKLEVKKILVYKKVKNTEEYINEILENEKETESDGSNSSSDDWMNKISY